MEELEVNSIFISVIDDIEEHIKLIKESYLKDNITLCRIHIRPYSINSFRITYYRELTEELKEEIRITAEKKEAERIARNKAYSEKMSEAAKKGWIKRHEREKKAKEERNLKAKEYAEKQLAKRQAKEAEKLRIEQEKDFLHKLLYEEE